MKKVYATIVALCATVSIMASGWPSQYKGVMLQGFYWDSFSDSKWTKLENQADNFTGYFDLIWVPQSGNCNSGTSMGYNPYYFFDQNSSFGTKDQLKSMISTFKSKGIYTIADVVINHHNTDGWFTFPKETYNGNTYQLLPSDIVADDDGGNTKAEAAIENVKLSSNNDDGEGWNGMRDLDHQSTNVQTVVKAYEKFLTELGYAGFRYDMVKGFNGSHVKNYNIAAGVDYSVGECWSDNGTIEKWINATEKNSAAFDFQFRYNIRDAIRDNNWSLLNSTNNLVHDAAYRRYAVTFVENHDTEKRSDAAQDPISKDTLAANAYLLAMPGTPCVFYKHFQAYPVEIKNMIDARKIAGITNESNYSCYRQGTTYYANTVDGENGQLLVSVGTGMPEPGTSNWTKILSGYHYAYYLSSSMGIPFANIPSGVYSDAFNVTLTAVSNTAGAKLVYTLDGNAPTSSSTLYTGPINITKSCTLTVGLLINGVITKTITRNYIFKEAVPDVKTPIKIYVNADNAGSSWSSWKSGINIWAWNDAGSVYASWPGQKITTTATVNGKTWIVGDYEVTTSNPTMSFVFSINSGKPQTVDVANIDKTSYFEVTSSTTNDNNIVNNVTDATGISSVSANTDESQNDNNWYTIQGLKITQPVHPGCYIHNGKKIVVK